MTTLVPPALTPFATTVPHGCDAWAVAARGARLEAAGEAVINLGIGDPDVATPGPVVAAAEQAL